MLAGEADTWVLTGRAILIVCHHPRRGGTGTAMTTNHRLVSGAGHHHGHRRGLHHRPQVIIDARLAPLVWGQFIVYLAQEVLPATLLSGYVTIQLHRYLQALD